MKLSSMARRTICEQIELAFGAELESVEKAIAEITERQNSLWKKFQKDLKPVIAKAKDGFLATMKKNNLHWAGKELGLCDEDQGVRFYETIGHYTEVGPRSFAETWGGSEELKKAEAAKSNVVQTIEKAIAEAMLEIELHGKRDTVMTIVDTAIKNGKKKLLAENINNEIKKGK